MLASRGHDSSTDAPWEDGRILAHPLACPPDAVASPCLRIGEPIAIQHAPQVSRLPSLERVPFEQSQDPAVGFEQPDAWELVVNKQTGQWGLDYAAAQDLGRVKMTMAKSPAPTERLKWVLTDKGNGKGELRLEWEDRVATVPMTVR